MSELSELKPRERRRIIDLVRAAGVNVGDWGKFKGGEKNAASNPKYCYEWSFVEPRKLIVLNLWYESMRERDGLIVQAATKRQREAAVLQKYLGTGTLRGASVGQLRAAHFRLLLGLRKLVKALLRNPTGAV